ncbi:hypothetical protein K461DRAFT_319223 [Myriangium duriaei CBS 260.36]|uniref:Uncharacterized protein n=1 Tax=Myriangium duriaei CBS 260.36 TaxID=1168546 RepID=A0A9P4J943_9PEZI|nr:hypothetical protein K461DRAFT_319223 [Myriangium duriaei CBS 260.36]
MSSAASPQQGKSWASIFSLPAPLRDLFNQFPLRTYASNPLPSGTVLPSTSTNTLYIFSNPSSVPNAPSLNPTCLKHQTYLSLRGIQYVSLPANNHASPSGSLPFLLPASSTDSPRPAPVTAASLRRWADDYAGVKDKDDVQLDVHAALLDHRLRRAWLYQLYLDPANAPAVEALYVAPASRSSAVRLFTAAQLRKAAAEELRKSGGAAMEEEEEEELVEQGREALRALDELLTSREGRWFSGSEEPGWFDAMVYAYTGPLLDERMGWVRNGLGDALLELHELRQHRRRIGQRCGWD